MDRRIATSTDNEVRHVLERLTDGSRSSEPPVFESKQKALMFAAGLGHYRSQRKPLASRDAGGAIRFELFQRAVDEGFIYAVGVAEHGDLKALDDKASEAMASCFEEYANAGLWDLATRLDNSPDDTLDAVVELIMRAENQARPDDAGAGLPADVLGLLAGL